MTDGYILSPELAEQVQRVVRRVLRENRGTVPASGKHGGTTTSRHWAVLDGTLDYATNGITTPKTADATILKMGSNGTLTRTDTVTVSHRYEHIQLEQDTLVRIEYTAGEWIVVAADCAPLESPPT